MAETSSHKPEDKPFKQQRLPAWQPVLTPNWVIGFFFVVGVVFVPLGSVIQQKSDQITEYQIQYDGSGTSSAHSSCQINETNANVNCTISIEIQKDIAGPIYVYYQLSNFYQNHRRYVQSRNDYQLQGTVYTSTSSLTLCDPLTSDGSLVLSPCGLIANTLFNDVISLKSSKYTLNEENIAWKTDVEHKFSQPIGFEYAKVSSSSVDCSTYVSSPCSIYCDTGSPYGYETEVGSCYAYYYPDDDKIKYLYETYSMVVNPIDGVKNEHFIVWMRTAGLPEFRKLYGTIDSSLSAGDILEFNITNNFEVTSFSGKKWLVLSTTEWFGGKNPFLGYSYIVIGSICLGLGAIFLFKLIVFPKKNEEPASFDHEEEKN